MFKERTKIVRIDFTDERTGDEYRGTLKLSRKSIDDDSTISALKSIYNRGMAYASSKDEDLATLKATVFTVYSEPDEQAKKWFSVDKIFSNDLISKLHKDHIDFELSFWRSDKRTEFIRNNPGLFKEHEDGSEEKSKGQPDNQSDSMVGKTVSRTSESEGKFISDVSVG